MNEGDIRRFIEENLKIETDIRTDMSGDKLLTVKLVMDGNVISEDFEYLSR